MSLQGNAVELSSRLTLIKRTSIEQMLDNTSYVKRDSVEKKDKTITEFYTRAEDFGSACLGFLNAVWGAWFCCYWLIVGRGFIGS